MRKASLLIPLLAVAELCAQRIDPSQIKSNSENPLLIKGAAGIGNGIHQIIWAAEGYPVYRMMNTQGTRTKAYDSSLSVGFPYSIPRATYRGKFSATGSDNTITRISGTAFTSDLADGYPNVKYIVLNSATYVIRQWLSADQLIVDPRPPFQVGGSYAIEDYHQTETAWTGGSNDPISSSWEVWTQGFFAMGRPKHDAMVSAQWNPLSGICAVSGNVVTVANGDLFVPAMVGQNIYIDGSPYLVAGYTDSAHITISGTPAISGYVEWMNFTVGRTLNLNFGTARSGSLIDTYRSQLKVTEYGMLVGQNVLNSVPAFASNTGGMHVTAAAQAALLAGQSSIATLTVADGQIYRIDVVGSTATVRVASSWKQRPNGSPTDTDHGLVVGQSITLAGATTETDLNGTYTIATTSSAGCTNGSTCLFTIPVSSVTAGTYSCEVAGTCEYNIYLQSKARYLYMGYDEVNKVGLLGAFDSAAVASTPIKVQSKLMLSDLPTSCSGQLPTTIYNDTGTLKVCP